ncbi:hypothetical protein [Paraburkholderia eburnea]|uniref:hypothetical protein n=1 Tax=Paraburkholderia eburnea TaxID=1189126 RepID=UPI0011B0673F|nr:hypothetical protein [Paraburkholderia eburnea]
MNDARWIAADRLDGRLWCLRTYGMRSLFRGSPGTDKDNVGTRLAGDLARPAGIEPATPAFGEQIFYELSYNKINNLIFQENLFLANF